MKFDMKILIFNSFCCWDDRKEEKPKWRMDLLHSVIYLLYNSK